MDMYEQVRQRNDLETELLHQKNLVVSLQAKVEVLQAEVKQSRQDVMGAEQVVNELSQQVTNQEAEIHQRTLEFEAQLKAKDEVIDLKSQALDELARENIVDFQQTPLRAAGPYPNARANQPRSALFEENVDLRRKLVQKQSEIDYQTQRFNDLLKDVRQRPFHTNLEQEQYIQEQEERLIEFESQLREEQMRINALEVEKAQLTKRSNEVGRQNTMLIAQFSEQFLPCYYSDTTTEDDLRAKLDDIQNIIQTNIQLQQRIEDLESNRNDDLPVLNSGPLRLELDRAKAELTRLEQESERSTTLIKRLQTSVDFYKMKLEESEEAGGSNTPMETDSIRLLRKRPHPDSDFYKLQAEYSLTSERLAALTKEKQQSDKNYEELMEKKNKLLTELHASKAALELKVQTQTTVFEDMEKRLNDIDKTNRKLEEQRIKTTSEYSTMKTNFEELRSRFNEIESENQMLSTKNRSLDEELDGARCELAELRTKCSALAENEKVSQNVASTLDEFRAAYLQLDNEQLVQAREQITSLRKDNETLANFVKAMNVQQMFAMDKLKSTLADAQLQREAYSQECTTLKQKLNTLQLEHDELTEKHNTLTQQLVDIDTSDATLESCRKQIQQLRNKISYLEKTVAESNARAEKWNVQLAVSERQCKTLKEITESLERNLHENEEKSLRECNRLQELCNTANNQYEQGQTTIADLRTEISDLNTRFATREAQLEQEISDWNARVQEMEQQKLELNSQLDRINGELQSVRNHEQELVATLGQKEVEIGDLNDLKNALDDACNQKAREVEECRIEIQALGEKLTNSDAVTAEIRQGLQIEIDALQQKVAIFEKAQFDEYGNRQSVVDGINQLLTRIADETDQLPVNLQAPDLNSSSEMSKALEIIERMQREKKEEMNRRLQLIAEQQSAISTTPAEEMVPMREFNAVVTKLRSQIDAQTAEIQQKMQQISELQLLEGLRERCEFLQNELDAARQSFMDLKAKTVDENQRRSEANKNAALAAQQQIAKLAQDVQTLNTKVEEGQNTIVKMRALAKKYKDGFETATRTLNMMKEQAEKKAEEKPEEQPTIVAEEQPPAVEKIDAD